MIYLFPTGRKLTKEEVLKLQLRELLTKKRVKISRIEVYLGRASTHIVNNPHNMVTGEDNECDSIKERQSRL